MEYSDKEIARFWSKVDKSGECWIWTASLGGSGYGQIGFLRDGRTRNIRSNRMAYEIGIGPIPDGMLVDHTCFVKRCCNPEHLRLATQKQNMENRPGPNKNSSSGIRGVSFCNRSKKWKAHAMHNGRKINAGTHLTREAAEEAAIALRKQFFTHNDLDRQAA